MFKVITKLSKSSLIFSIVTYLSLFSPLIPWTVLAVLDPTIDVSITNFGLGESSDLTITFGEPQNTDFASTKIYKIPAGWDIAAGDKFPQDAVIGSGTFEGIVNGNKVNVAIKILNDTNLEGYKAHWKFSIAGGAVILDSYLDGDSTKGHTFSVTAPKEFVITAPTTASITFNGNVGGVKLVTNPSTIKEYSWQIEFRTEDGQSVTQSKDFMFSPIVR